MDAAMSATDRVTGLTSMGVGITEQELQAALADVWDEAVRECHDLGWLHDFALSDALARNPYGPEATQ
jgi:hypothetical protein